MFSNFSYSFVIHLIQLFINWSLKYTIINYKFIYFETILP